MPGPRNSSKPKKPRTSKGKAQDPKPSKLDHRTSLVVEPSEHTPHPSPPPFASLAIENALMKEPAIYDPGNGPRVKNIHAFLASSFSSPPSLDDDLCAEFAQEEMLDMLCTVLSDELALCLWYNKSRKTSRICPCCTRLYRLGDILSNLLQLRGEQVQQQQQPHPLSRVEQEISGLCSPACFIIASINYPEAIRLIYGKMAEEMEEVTWEFLNTRGDGRGDDELSMLLRMTRLHDLGLAQLCLPGIQLPEDEG